MLFATHLTLKYSLRMGSNAVFQSAFKDSQTGKISNDGWLLSGFGAGVLEALTIVIPLRNMLDCMVKFMESISPSPLWCAWMVQVVKIRLQQQKGLSTELLKYKGPVHCARTIIREEGLHVLWAGAAPTVNCKESTRGELKYKGMIHAIRTIDAEEGIFALWKGLLPRLMRIPPGQAITSAVADQVTGLFERRYIRNAAPL
ncbi:hypothetical protein Ddye_012904 [Dipteronia dyeriana]|uniref:Uncharacterized protein n=1 Tax=Dipteronia dyeriana TaxID=168575 RepID=A0AAD9X5L3_9ROSI|nr:hypothetical protein Ddye_012904 [Dipteronia dyeriana]